MGMEKIAVSRLVKLLNKFHQITQAILRRLSTEHTDGGRVEGLQPRVVCCGKARREATFLILSANLKNTNK